MILEEEHASIFHRWGFHLYRDDCNRPGYVFCLEVFCSGFVGNNIHHESVKSTKRGVPDSDPKPILFDSLLSFVSADVIKTHSTHRHRCSGPFWEALVLLLPVLAGVDVAAADLRRGSVLHLTVAVVDLSHGLVNDSHARDHSPSFP